MNHTAVQSAGCCTPVSGSRDKPGHGFCKRSVRVCSVEADA